MVELIKKYGWIILAVVVVLLFLYINLGLTSKGSTSNDVRVKELKREDFSVIAHASGVIESNVYRNIYFDNDIRIENVFVEKNQLVSEGQKLFTYDVDKSKKSDIDGVVTHVNIAEGIIFNRGQSAISIVGTDNLRVRANVRENDVEGIEKDNKVQITGAALKKPLTGKVISVSPIATRKKTLYGEEVFFDVMIDISSTDVKIKPNITVDCEIEKEIISKALTTSINTIKDLKGKKTVFVVDKSSDRLVEKEVQIGAVSDLTVEIVGDKIKEKDWLVVDPKPEFGSETKVNIISVDKR